jgi:multiple sugar transport system substrate-binding protein
LPLTHHRLHSRFDNWSESVKWPQRNLRLFQQNRPEADLPGRPQMRLPEYRAPDTIQSVIQGGSIMHAHAVLVALALILAPLGARAADLVVWWEKGFYAQEDEAVREIIAAFEQQSGKRVELTFYPQAEFSDNIAAAVEAGRPPDFAFSLAIDSDISPWAFDDRLVNLTDAVGHFSDLFDPDALAWWTLLNGRTGRKALYGLPMGRSTNHIHVWASLLEQAGFTLDDVPKDWSAFWSFWCDEVQPAVRRATGRDDLWGIGLSMSVEAGDTQTQFRQFVFAYEGDWVTRDGQLVIDDPEIRLRLVKAIDDYTAIYRKGCTPPDALTWADIDNNEQFHAQAIIMTPNNTLSIVNALKRERSEDYYENTATIEWPLGPDGKPFPIKGSFYAAAVFKDGGHLATAKDFVRFLVTEGWLAHYLDFAGERLLPPMPKLLEQPFWLDPSDRHRMAAVMQISSRPMQHDYITVTGDWRHDRVTTERVWQEAIHRVAAEGISPEQAVDEAIAQIKQILSE